MKSPFPGMDPYLEARWGDVHTSLVTYARDQLQRQMPPQLRVRVEEHVTVHLGDSGIGSTPPTRGRFPDVRVIENPTGTATTSSPAPPAEAIAVATPLLVPLQVEEQTQRSVQIIDTQTGNSVVTVLEFLSPANKSDPRTRTAYQEKQQELWQAGVNLVEIDLLRSGPYVLAAPAHLVPLPYLAPYRVCILRSSRPGHAEMFRVSLRERLPVLPIPLRAGDPDARLDLQELIDKAYENAGYDLELDYRVDPFPPLQGDDAAWADALLREKGRR